MAALCVQTRTCVCLSVQLYSSCDLTLFWKSGYGRGKHAGLGDTCSAGEAWVSPGATRRSEAAKEPDSAGSGVSLEERAK